MKAMLCFLLIAVCAAGAQEMEESTERDNGGVDDAVLLSEELDYYRENPIRLGSATFADLSALPFLSPLLARKILDFRDERGIQTMGDLLLIPGCDERVMRRLANYVTIEPSEGRKSRFSDFLSHTQGAFRSRINSNAAGAPLSSSSRMRFSSSSMDAGVSYLRTEGNSEAKTDGYLRWSTGDQLPSIIAGDFVVHAGQGLLFAGSSRSGKSGLPDQVRGRGSPIAPRLSLSDPLTQRGIALKEDFRLGRFLFFRSTAYTGGSCEIHSEGVTFGGSILRPLDGNVPMSAGTNAEVLTGGFDLFGEVAGNSTATLSSVAGFLYSPVSSVEVAARVQRYLPRYENPLAHPFSESGSGKPGEQGRSFGIAVRPLQYLKLSLVAGAYEYVPASSFAMNGREYVLRADVLLTRKNRVTMFIRRKETSDELNAGKSQTNVRLILLNGFDLPLEFSERIEYTIVSGAKEAGREKGILLLTDAAIRLAEERVSLKGRMIVFQTDGYESRLYEYEENVRGASAVPPLYGRGLRWYILAECRIIGGILFSARYAETVSWNQGISRTFPRQVTFQAEAVF